MIYTIQEFCDYVLEDLNAFIDEVAPLCRNVSDEEKKAYAGSYPDSFLTDEDKIRGNRFDGLSDEQKERQDQFYKQHKDGTDRAQTMMMVMYI